LYSKNGSYISHRQIIVKISIPWSSKYELSILLEVLNKCIMQLYDYTAVQIAVNVKRKYTALSPSIIHVCVVYC